jgi:hypothetical protein
MEKKNTIRFIVDSEVPSNARSALPLPQFSSIATQSVEITREAACKSFGTAIQDVMEILSTVPSSTHAARVIEVKFTLTINVGGEVSIVSLAKGQLSGATGLEFTIRLGNSKDEDDN